MQLPSWKERTIDVPAGSQEMDKRRERGLCSTLASMTTSVGLGEAFSKFDRGFNLVKRLRDVRLTGVVSGHLHLGCNACGCAVLLLVLLDVGLQLHGAVGAELRELGLDLLAPLLALLNISAAHALKPCSPHKSQYSSAYSELLCWRRRDPQHRVWNPDSTGQQLQVR